MKPRLVLPLLALLLLSAGGASAEGWRRELPPDERREMRQQMREQWLQRERPGPQHAYDDGRPSRSRDFPPDERRRLRDEMREQHDRDDRRGKRHRYDD